MDVDFNNLRKQAIYAYDRLAQRLNAHIEKDPPSLSGPHVVIPVSQIDDLMSDLRGCIGTIACVHDDENPDFKEVFSEVFPPEKYKGPCMTIFNPEEEDEI